MGATSASRVSVIIPVHNRQALGERAVRSAAAQMLPDMEIIIVDDGSAPAFVLPPDVAEHTTIRLVRQSDNRGASAARNSGIREARSDWLALLDSDDYWLADTLRTRLEIAERTFAATGDAAVVHAAAFLTDDRRIGRRHVRIPIESAKPIDFASGCWFAPGSTLIARKEAFDRAGPYDEALRRLEDLDWFLRLALAGGSLKVWNGVAAVVEISDNAPFATIETVAGQLHEKYGAEGSPLRLPPDMLRHLEAYLDVERASSTAAERQWLSTAYFLARSVWRVPRAHLHLKRFWAYGALPPGLDAV